MNDPTTLIVIGALGILLLLALLWGLGRALLRTPRRSRR